MKRRLDSLFGQFAAAILVSISVAGCSIHWNGTPAVQGSGKNASQSRNTGEFTGLALASAADVEVTISDKTSVVIEGDDNLLPYITTEVENGVLTISNQVSYRTQLGIRVYVTTPNLASADVSGSGRISSEKIEAKQFEASIAGSGEINIEGLIAGNVVASVPGSGQLHIKNLKAGSFSGSVDGSGSITAVGTAQTLEVSTAGSGSLDLADLKSRDANVSIAGSGSADVLVTGKLEGSVAGSGSIRYSGSPKEVVRSISGSGSITAK
jgi:hypothetical protein